MHSLQQVAERSPLPCEALNAIHDMVLILNQHRHIVAASTAAHLGIAEVPPQSLKVILRYPGTTR
jgi:hypothetical protein